MKSNYDKNNNNQKNFEKAQQRKSFTQDFINENDQEVYDNWLDYLQDNLDQKSDTFPWSEKLNELLDEQTFKNETKIQSQLFYKEFLFKTVPDALKNEIQYTIENQGDLNMVDLSSLECKTGKNFTELDITDNLGGSFMTVDMK